MEIRILGCSGGRIPGYELSSYLVDDRLLIDAGGAASILSIEEQESINHVLITHAHLDHILGLGLIYENTSKTRLRPLELYATEEVIRVTREHLFNPEILPVAAGDQSGLSAVNFHAISLETPFKIGSHEVEAFPVFHTRGSVAYRVSDDHHTFLFTGDTGRTDRIWRWISKRGGVDCLVAEISFPEKMASIAALSRHLTPGELFQGLGRADFSAEANVHVVHLKPAFLGELMDEIDGQREWNLIMLRRGDVIRLEKGRASSQVLQARVEEKVRDKLVEFDASADLYDQRDRLAEQFGISAGAGEVIFNQGDRSKVMYVIQEGRVKIVREAGGQGKTLSLLGPGDFFGEMAMLNNRPRSATAVAVTDVRLLAFDRGAFEKLVLDNFGVALRLIRTLSQRLQQADVIIENLLFFDPHSKVVNTLIQAAYDEGIETNQGLQVRITPEELSELSGVVIATLREILSELVSEKLILAKRETIIIPNVNRLKRLLKFIELKGEFM